MWIEGGGVSDLTGKVDGVSSSESGHSTLSGRWKENGPNQGHIKQRLCRILGRAGISVGTGRLDKT